MTNDKYTDIEIILDASGSMGPIRNDMLGVVNSFIEGLKAEAAGKCTISLTKFYGLKIEKVWSFVLLENVTPLTKEQYVVSGTTPLLDAIGRSISETEEYVSKLFEDDRPARILKIIITDGEENSSITFTAPTVKKLISECKLTGIWEFQFLGSGSESFLDAASIGLNKDNYIQWTASDIGTYAAGKVITGSTISYTSRQADAFVNMQLKYDEALASEVTEDSDFSS